MQEEPLKARLDAATELIDDLPARRRITVVADADVDGTAAAAILTRSLHRLGRRFHVMLTRRRDERLVQLVKDQSPSFLITADLGATLVPHLRTLRVPAVILDHHEPRGDGDGEGFVHVNPHLVGEDGSTSASGAAVSYRFAQALLSAHGQAAADLLPYALLGAWGDRYHGADTQSGLHARLYAEARETEGVLTWQAWAPDAPKETPLPQALAQNLDPVIPVFGGDGEQAAALLHRLGIPRDARMDALDDDPRSTLISWIAATLLEHQADPGLTDRLLSHRPAFEEAGPLNGHAMAEVAQRVDAATRSDDAPTALAALLGDPEAWQRLEAGLATYREAVTRPIWRARHAAVRLGPGHLVRIEHGFNAGPVADRLMAWTPLGTAPVVVMGSIPRGFKISMRARSGTPWRLDRIAEESARASGGAGGGHRLAAGAILPADKEARFLEQVAERLKKGNSTETGALDTAEVAR